MAANVPPAVPPVPVPPAPPAALTVLDGIIACGFNNVIQVNAGNTSQAQRVASQLYFDDFAMCLTLTDKQIDNAFKAFSDLTIADGRIKVMPGLITKVKAFTQHVAHTLRLQLNPEEQAFDPTQTVMLTKQRVQQVKFESDSKSEIDGAKPALFSTTTVWIEWNRAFYNYLKLIPSSRGIPLCYIIRPNDIEDRTEQTLFQDAYILVAPLTGADYNTDNAKAFTLLKALVAGNAQAEAILNANEATRDCRQAHKDLKMRYEGVGITAPARTIAEKDIAHMYYNGERPNFTWLNFESRLKDAYKTINDLENREVYSNTMKLSRLLDAVKADFLQHVKSSITVAMGSNPNYSFTAAMTAFKTEVIDDPTHAVVKKRAVGEDGRPQGTAHANPLLDNRAYEVEFMDGHIETLTANVIAENLLAQVDDDGHRHLMLDEIEDYRKDETAIPKQEGTYKTDLWLNSLATR